MLRQTPKATFVGPVTRRGKQVQLPDPSRRNRPDHAGVPDTVGSPTIQSPTARNPSHLPSGSTKLLMAIKRRSSKQQESPFSNTRRVGRSACPVLSPDDKEDSPEVARPARPERVACPYRKQSQIKGRQPDSRKPTEEQSQDRRKGEMTKHERWMVADREAEDVSTLPARSGCRPSSRPTLAPVRPAARLRRCNQLHHGKSRMQSKTVEQGRCQTALFATAAGAERWKPTRRMAERDSAD